VGSVGGDFECDGLISPTTRLSARGLTYNQERMQRKNDVRGV
jgi:hypothetical protein